MFRMLILGIFLDFYLCKILKFEERTEQSKKLNCLLKGPTYRLTLELDLN